MLTVRLEDVMEAARERWPRAISRTALREVLEAMASDLLGYARGAFAAQRDPATGQAWVGPAPRTLRDAGFRSLLVRTGELLGSITSEVRLGEGGGEAALTLPPVGAVVRRGLVHMFGAQAKRRQIPQRRWAGYPMGTVRRWAMIMRDAFAREAGR